MSDTKRSTAQILALLGNNTAGDISAQDLRDVVVSLIPSFGRVSMYSNATETIISGAGNFTKVLGTTTMSGSEVDFDDDGGTSNRLRYTGASPRHLVIRANASSTTSPSANQRVLFKFWHYDSSAGSGSYITSSEAESTAGTAGGARGLDPVFGDVLVGTNDYIELHAACVTSNHIVVTSLNMLVSTILV